MALFYELITEFFISESVSRNRHVQKLVFELFTVVKIWNVVSDM